jgi:adenylylsulfate kinase-like enzyme
MKAAERRQKEKLYIEARINDFKRFTHGTTSEYTNPSHARVTQIH